MSSAAFVTLAHKKAPPRGYLSGAGAAGRGFEPLERLPALSDYQSECHTNGDPKDFRACAQNPLA